MVLDVVWAGYCCVQELLSDSHGNSSGFAVYRETCQSGRQDAPPLFFGLLFQEIRRLAVTCWKPGPAPESWLHRERAGTEIPTWPSEYWARVYRLDCFSDREWESDVARRRSLTHGRDAVLRIEAEGDCTVARVELPRRAG